MRPRHRQLHKGVSFHESDIDHVALDDDRVHLADGTVLAVRRPDRRHRHPTRPRGDRGAHRAGLDGEASSPSTRPRAPTALAEALTAFEGGKLVVNIVDMPIKCPVAPIEFAFLADWYLRERGIRDRTEIVLATPLDGCFTKPIASKHLTYLLEEKEIGLEVEFSAGEVDGAGGRLVSYDGREIPFDLLVTVPVHSGAEYVGRSPGLGDDLDFVPTNPRTLQSLARENVFALGDATNVPTSKAGSVTHFEGELLTENIERYLAGKPLEESFDGHANCFIETGFGKALLIDFNYETEPLPGRFPSAARAAAAPPGVPAQPPREADVPVDVLAPAAARARHPGHLARHAHDGQEARRDDRVERRKERQMTTIELTAVDRDAEGFLTIHSSGTRRSPPRSRARPASTS